jgi:hypothetical protein
VVATWPEVIAEQELDPSDADDEPPSRLGCRDRSGPVVRHSIEWKHTQAHQDAPATAGYVASPGDVAIYGLSLGADPSAAHMAIVTDDAPDQSGPDVVNGDGDQTGFWLLPRRDADRPTASRSRTRGFFGASPAGPEGRQLEHAFVMGITAAKPSNRRGLRSIFAATDHRRGQLQAALVRGGQDRQGNAPALRQHHDGRAAT